jgi:hypothetical protein
LLATKLCLQFKAVKKWYKHNEYNQDQLERINKQVTYNEIKLPPLVSSIIYRLKYRISI